jgi:hypothetical protein
MLASTEATLSQQWVRFMLSIGPLLMRLLFMR